MKKIIPFLIFCIFGFVVGLTSVQAVTSINTTTLNRTYLTDDNGSILRTSGFPSLIISINDIDLGWKIFNNLKFRFNVWSECKNVQPPIGYKLFVPTRTQSEWNAFKTGSQLIGTLITECGSCTGTLPANATSTTTSLSSSAPWNYSESHGACTFRCNTNYSYNSIDKSCIREGTTRMQNCGGSINSGNTSNATTSSGYYAQVWINSQWYPQLSWHGVAPTYDTASRTDYCWIKCDAGYGWNGYNCIKNGPSSCTGTLDPNGEVNGNASYGPNYMITNGVPNPDLPWKYNRNGNWPSQYCGFVCKNGYSWSGTGCLANQVGSCTGTLPAVTGGNMTLSPATYERTWQNGALSPEATTAWSLNGPRCSYSCSSGYSWSGTGCLQDVVANCSGAIPTNTYISSGPTYTRSWQSNGTLSPGDYIAYTLGGSRCGYNCNSGYTWRGRSCEVDCASGTSWAGTSCLPNQSSNCSGTLPANAYSYNTVYNQTWQSDGTLTPVTGIPYHDAYYLNWNFVSECLFYCDSGYSWDGSKCAKTANVLTRPENCESNIPNDAEKSTSTIQYPQASFDNGSTWTPTGIGWVYGGNTITLPDGTSQIFCGFKCKSGKTWDGTSCQ